jgi:hypothetical protein
MVMGKAMRESSPLAFSKTCCVIVLQAAVGGFAASNASAQESTPDLLAAQLREQGDRCDKPASAHRDLARSKPDEAVWVLRCETDRYRIRLTPDMAAHVQRLK